MSPDPGGAGRRSRSRCRTAGAPAGPARSSGRVQPRPSVRLCGWGIGWRCRGAGYGLECVFDGASDRVDRCGVLADGVELAVLAPACDVGDRFAADVERDRGADDVGHTVHEHLAAFAAEFVAEPVRMCELVHERADLPVGRPCGDRDLLALGVAPTGRPVLWQVANLDAVAELPG